MAAPAYVNGATAQTTGTSITLSKPSGALDGHIAVATLYVEDLTDPTTVPSGFTQKTNASVQGYAYVRTYWKRLSSDPASWTWSFAPSANWYGGVGVFSGCRASGDPFSFGTAAGGSGTAWPNISGTTLDIDELLLYFPMAGWTGAITYPAGFTAQFESADLVSRLGTKPQNIAGATGNISATHAGGATDFGATLLGLRPVATTGATMTPSGATLTATGNFPQFPAGGGGGGGALMRNFGRTGGHRG